MSSASDTGLEEPLDADPGDRRAALPADPSEGTGPIGRELAGGYVVEGLLGSGPLGRTYRARPSDPPGSYVALKLFHASLRDHDTFRRRLTRDVDAASKLEHPNIARIVAQGEDPEQGLYVCRELIDGSDLLTAARSDVITPKRLCELFGQLLSALSEAHRNGVLHLNLKPQNVLVSRDASGTECVKVCDFGSPLRIRAGAEYMAPEQRSGRELDGRADVYAVGVMLYEVLTGDVPFRGATADETLAMHQTELVVPPHERCPEAALPRELEAVCLKALAKDPAERHRSPREMSQALRAVVSLLGLRAEEPLGSSAFTASSLDALEPINRMTMPGEQLRSRTKFWLGAGLVVAVCAAVLLNPEPKRTDHPDRQPARMASGGGLHNGTRALADGMELLRKGDAQGAVIELRHAQQTLGDTPEVLRALGEALMIQGSRSEGAALLSRYLELEPNARDRSFVENLVRSGQQSK